MSRKWTESDVNYLKDNIGTLTFYGIAQHLGRTETAVIVKAKRLKLGTYTSNSEFCTIDEACELLGITRKTLMKKVRKGTLKPLRKNIRGGAYRMFFRYEELKKFKKAYAKPAQKKWTAYETSLLKLYCSKGMTEKQISERLCRSVQSIRKRKRAIK